MFDDRLTISAEQQKLISNATRIQILHLLKDEALTAKQVATKLNKSTGSVHYHVQILYDGGLLELVDTKENEGLLKNITRQNLLISILKKAAQRERIQVVILFLIYFNSRGITTAYLGGYTSFITLGKQNRSSI